MSYGTAPGIQFDSADAVKILGRAEFMTTCTDVCLGPVAKTRQYAYVQENRLETNSPFGMFGPCTCADVCTVDVIGVTYFDRPPTRVGMCCWVIPATCCGPPVIYSYAPSCCGVVSLVPCCGVTIKAAPCNCYNLKTCICLGQPCYDSFGSPILTSLSEPGALAFIQAYSNAVNAYKGKPHGVGAGEFAQFQNVTDDVVGLADKTNKVAPQGAPPSAEGPAAPTKGEMVRNAPKLRRFCDEVVFVIPEAKHASTD